MEPILSKLLECNQPWVIYRTYVDILGLSDTEPKVVSARIAMLEHPFVKNLIEELKDWPGVVMSSHKSSSQCYHKLAFLADIGVNVEDDGISGILEKVRSHRASDGIFSLPMNIPQTYGGSGITIDAWALCDAPTLLYALKKMDPLRAHELDPLIDRLVGLGRVNGWPCAVSEELGSWRGPGRKQDPCPYANLLMLKLLACDPVWIENPVSVVGIECLLDAWQRSSEYHPYIFYMGNDFRKLKAPFIWYDLLHVLDVLSRYPTTKNDLRLLDMVSHLKEQIPMDGLIIPGSVWQAWKDWDFGQKKMPSLWITFLAQRILKRFEG